MRKNKKNLYAQRKPDLSVPNVTYIPSARVGSNMLCVGPARLFEYQHFGIWSRLGSNALGAQLVFQLQSSVCVYLCNWRLTWR